MVLDLWLLIGLLVRLGFGLSGLFVSRLRCVCGCKFVLVCVGVLIVLVFVFCIVVIYYAWCLLV